MKKSILIILLAMTSVGLFSQQKTASLHENPWEEYKSSSQNSIFKDVQWNTIGPKSIGGHISHLASIPGNSDVIFAISGWRKVAVWKTVDGGYTWKPVLEKGAPHYGAVSISQSNPDIVWVGASKEPRSGKRESPGIGIFKSVDLGETWENMGLHELQSITDIAIHPSNADIIYASGNNHNDSLGRGGVYKTIDGGQHWQKVFHNDSLKGMNKIYLNPVNHDILYAYSETGVNKKRIRIFKTENGGEEWEPVMDGLPKSEKITDIGMAVATSKSNVVYSLIKHKVPSEDTSKKEETKIHIFRSDDYGEHWEKTGEQKVDFGFMVMEVSPDNADEIYLGSVHVWHSTDRGKTLNRIADNVFHIYPNPGTFMHLDQMDLWINPENPDNLILGNDGGIYRTKDRGRNWLHMNSFPMGEFYYVATNKEDPVEVYGGNQDNSSVYGPGDVNLLEGFPDHWEYVRMDPWSGGDGFFTHPVPGKKNWFYYSSQFGNIVRKNLETKERKYITPKLDSGKLERAWHTPIVVSHYNPAILIYGGNHIMKSVNRGDSWISISKDMTVAGNNEKKSGGRVSSLIQSSIYEGLLYTGTSNGLVWCTKNGGGEWENISDSLPRGNITSIAASKFDSAQLYVTISSKGNGDFMSYIYSSSDYGESWQRISGGIYSDPVNKILEDPGDKNVLYAGTDKGVYVTIDKGEKWHSLSYNLPSCAVRDMAIHKKAEMLIAGTYGRGIYSADIKSLREYRNDTVDEKDYYLFDMRAAKEIFRKPNRVRKAVFSFYLHEVPKKEIALNIQNDQDSTIHTLKPDVSKGFNQLTWDLRMEQPVIKSKYYNVLGKFLRKGKYQVQLVAGKKILFEKDMIVEKYITD